MGEEATKLRELLNPDYWNRRFESEETYEWLGSYEDVADLLRDRLQHSKVKPGSRVLVVGNGNSQMAQSFAKDSDAGLVVITDVSPIAVHKASERWDREASTSQGRDGASGRGVGDVHVQWAVCDMLHLPFQDGAFDLILEKGAMDVFEVDKGPDPWNPNVATSDRLHAWLDEAYRITADGGLLVSLSFAQPHFRMPYYEAGFNTTCHSYSSGAFVDYFMYCATKEHGGGSRRGPHRPGPPLHRTPHDAGPPIDTTHGHMDDEDFLLKMECHD